MADTAAPVSDKEVLAGLREEVYLEDVGKKLEETKAAEKKAAEEAEAKKKAEADAKMRAEAQAALPDDPRVKALSEALRISEEARERALAAVRATPASAAPISAEDKDLSTEEMNKLFQDNPLAAIDKLLAKREKVLIDNVNSRLGSLAQNNAETAREQAERKYPDEFRVFGRKIDEAIQRLPNPAALTSLKNWDDFMAWFRGQTGNFDTLVNDRAERAKTKAAEDARAAQAAGAGAHTVSTIRAPVMTSDGGLDPVAKEIAKTMGMSEEDYVLWRKAGQ